MMNDATSNQTAAEQGRKNYRDVTTADAAVPETVRTMVADLGGWRKRDARRGNSESEG